MKVKLRLEKDAALILCEVTKVTYALHAAVNEELQSLKDDGIQL